MPVFDYEFEVAAPLESVAHFHHDTSVLKRLTPPPVIIQMHHFEPMSEGAISEFTMWFGPLPVGWVAIHTHVDPLHGFTDTQRKGPLQEWHHTHHFSERDSMTTRVHEHIEYRHRAGWWGFFTRIVFSKLMLWLMFVYRKWVTRISLRQQSD